MYRGPAELLQAGSLGKERPTLVAIEGVAMSGDGGEDLASSRPSNHS